MDFWQSTLLVLQKHELDSNEKGSVSFRIDMSVKRLLVPEMGHCNGFHDLEYGNTDLGRRMVQGVLKDLKWQASRDSMLHVYTGNFHGTRNIE